MKDDQRNNLETRKHITPIGYSKYYGQMCTSSALYVNYNKIHIRK